ncbi:uncharacterized protein LOC131954909 isoform X2 [Physella acuta]|uniref:uncharacterized protein LOC131954909 isoform X2 n=1 Tax=Physella acuta TaxID=109671 RepID=UPI0027DC4DE2|nr:uncharacterized protein LOC131954909 isoform X2 [Physella acuta]
MMDDYDPACPTEEDDSQVSVMELDLSQVPLPPSAPVQKKNSKSKARSPSPHVTAKEGNKKGKRRKKKKRHSSSKYQTDEDDDVQETVISEDSDGAQAVHEPTVLLVKDTKASIKVPIQEPEVSAPVAQLYKDDPPLVSQSTKSTASAQVPAGSTQAGKLQFKLASDPGSGKTKVLFQLKKTLKPNALKSGSDDEDKEEVVEEEAKQIIEKTAAGEFVPTRFKVSKKHEMFRPSTVEALAKPVFDPALALASVMSAASQISAAVSALEAAELKEREGSDDEKGDDDRRKDSDKGLRRSDRRRSRKDSRESERDDSSSRYSRYKSRHDERDSDRNTRSTSSRRQRDDDRRKYEEQKRRDESSDRRRSSRIRQDQEDKKNKAGDSKESVGRRKSKVEENPSSDATKNTQRRRSHSTEEKSQPSPKSLSKSEDVASNEEINAEEAVTSEDSSAKEDKIDNQKIMDEKILKPAEEIASDENILEPVAVEGSHSPDATGPEASSAEPSSVEVSQPQVEVQHDSTQLKTETSESDEKKHIQKIVIRRSTETNDFEITRNDLARKSSDEGNAESTADESKQPVAEKLKQSTNASSESDHEKETKVDSATPVKRKRGRPRKISNQPVGRRKKSDSESSHKEDVPQKPPSPVPAKVASPKAKFPVYVPEPALPPEQVLVDVSAIPGKSKWEMDEEDEMEETVKRTSSRFGGYAADVAPVKTYEPPESTWRRSSRHQAKKVDKPMPISKMRESSSTGNEDDHSLDHGKHKKKHNHKSREKKGKKKKKHDDKEGHREEKEEEEKPSSGGLNSSSEKVGSEQKKKEESIKTKVDLDTAKLVTYLKEYSGKEESKGKEDVTKVKVEHDNSKIVSYLKEYSGKMTEETVVDQLEDVKQENVSLNTEESVNTEKAREGRSSPVDGRQSATLKSESKESSRENSIDKASMSKAKGRSNSPEKGRDRRDRSKSSEDNKEKTDASKTSERNRERRDRSKSSERSREKRDRSNSADRKREKTDGTKLSDRNRERRDRSKSSERTREKRDRSKSSERTREKRDRSKSLERTREKRDRSKSVERDRRRSQRSPDRRFGRSPYWRSRNRRNRSKSTSPDRRNRSKSTSPHRNDRRNRSKSTSPHRNDRRNRSRSKSPDKGYSYRRYQGSSRDYGRSGRKAWDRRRRSRSGSSGSSNERKRRKGSEEKSRKDKSPEMKEETIAVKPSEGSQNSEASASKEPELIYPEIDFSAIDLASIPIPGEIPLPIKKEADKESVIKEAEVKPIVLEDLIVDEPMEISDDDDASNGIEIVKDKVFDDVQNKSTTDLLSTSTLSIVESASTPDSGKDKQVKFSILGSAKKLKQTVISGVLDDGVEHRTHRMSLSILTEKKTVVENVPDVPKAEASGNVEVPKEEVVPTEVKETEPAQEAVQVTEGLKPSVVESGDDELSKPKAKEVELKPNVPPGKLKFKYVPLWEMEESEKRPVIEELPKKEEKNLSLALDYGSESSDIEDEERSPMKKKVPDRSEDVSTAQVVEEGVSSTEVTQVETTSGTLDVSEKGKVKEEEQSMPVVKNVELVEDKAEPEESSPVQSPPQETASEETTPVESSMQSPPEEALPIKSPPAQSPPEETPPEESSPAQHNQSDEAYSPSHPSLEDSDDIVPLPSPKTKPSVVEKTSSIQPSGPAILSSLPVPSITSFSQTCVPPATVMVTAPFTSAIPPVISSLIGTKPTVDLPYVAYPHIPQPGMIGSTQSALLNIQPVPPPSVPLPSLQSSIGTPIIAPVPPPSISLPSLQVSHCAPVIAPVPPPSISLPSLQVAPIIAPVPPPSVLGTPAVIQPALTAEAFKPVTYPTVPLPLTTPKPVPPPAGQLTWASSISSVLTQPLPTTTSQSLLGFQALPALRGLAPVTVAPVPPPGIAPLHTIPLPAVTQPMPVPPVTQAPDAENSPVPVQPVKYRISGFDQGPIAALPPPAVSIPTLLSVSQPSSTDANVVHSTQGSHPLSSSVTEGKAPSTPVVLKSSPALPPRVSSGVSKRPKISSILSQPKIEDPELLEKLSKHEVVKCPLPSTCETADQSSTAQSAKEDTKTNAVATDKPDMKPADTEAVSSQPEGSAQASPSVETSTVVAQDIDFDMTSIPLPESIPLPGSPMPQEPAKKEPESGSPHKSSEPSVYPDSSSAISPKSQTLGSLLADRKKRFSQSPLAIGMLPKVPLTQSPLAIGPLPKLPPEPESLNTDVSTSGKKSSLGSDVKSKPLISLGVKSKTPQLDKEEPKSTASSSSRIHIVLKSKSALQKTSVPGFEDEGSDNENASEEQHTEPASDVDSSILSTCGEEKAEHQTSAISSSEQGNEQEEAPVQSRPKIVNLTDIEAFPVQVITSTRKEEDTPASSWPEFTVAKRGREDEDGKKKQSDLDGKERSKKRDRRGSEEDEKRTDRKRRANNDSDDETDRRDHRRRRDDGNRKRDDDYDEDIRRKVKKELDDDGYEDRRGSRKDEKGDDRGGKSRQDKDDDSYGRRRSRDDSYSKRRGKDDDDEYRRRSRYDKDDYRKKQKYDSGRYSDSRSGRYSERDRSRERSRDRDRSPEHDRGDKSRSKSRTYKRSRKSRSRSQSPVRKRERSRERYDKTRDSRSRSNSRDRDRKSRDERGSRKKDSRSFKEDLLEEFTKSSNSTDVQDELFKVAAIGSSYVSEYPPDQGHMYATEQEYSSMPEPTMYSVPPPVVDVPPAYPDPNYASQYQTPYEQQQYGPWQSQPSHDSYSQDATGQYQPSDHQAPPPNQYPFHQQQHTHYPPPQSYQASPYLSQPGVPPQSLPPPHLQHASGGPPPHIPLDQHGQPIPGHYPPAQLPVIPTYNQAGPQTHLQPQFTQENCPPPHFVSSDSQFKMHSGTIRGSLLPLPSRGPLLQTPMVPRIVMDNSSSFGTPRFPPPDVRSSPNMSKPPSKVPRKPRVPVFDDSLNSETFALKAVVPTSDLTMTGSFTTTSARGEMRKSSTELSYEKSLNPEPSFETSSLAEAEFDTSVKQESKGKSRKKSNLEDVNEPTVSSSGVEDTTGDTGSDSGTDSSQKPLKVKSRWRRNSEAEAVVDTSTPPQASTPPPSTRGPTSPDASPKEMRRTRSRAAAEESGSNLETPPPPPPPRKRIKMEMESEELKLNTEQDMKTECIKEETEEPQDLATLIKRPDFPKFEIITENIHLTERKRSKSMKRMLCDCTTSREDRAMGLEACGSDCLNRMLMIECGSRCPCGEYCKNRRFQKKIYSKTLPFSAGDKGWGLRAEEDMEEKGTFIMEYVGELLDYEEFVRRTKQYSKSGLKHHYFMALNADEVVDATLKGSISRFINHSCDPNCETQKWTVNGELRVGFFTRKPVKKGEELTFDYQFEHYGEPQKCYCGSENCRGYIGLVKSPTRNNKKKERKKREIFKDELLEEDIEKLSMLEGMRNKNHVLELCRLMVRAEKVQQRIAILKILQGTTETACLRLFLDYHGLPLFWSWMADIGTADYSEDTQELKLLMLSVLKSLPITNRTVLKESKILDIVERWAVAAVAAARKPPPPPPPTSTTTTITTASVLPPVANESVEQEAAMANNEADAAATAPVDPSPEEPSLPTAVVSEPEQSTTSSSETSPPSSPSPTLPLPVSNVTPVSILASAKETKEAKQKRRVTFAEVHVETSFSPEPDEDIEDNDDISSSTQYTEDGADGKVVLPGEATAIGSNGDNVMVTSCLLPQSSSMADSTSQKDVFDAGDNAGMSSDTDNSDTESVIKDPLASLAAECMSQWSSLKEIFKIPKKERVEERKRTERELDVLSKKQPEASDPYAKWKRELPRGFVRKKVADDEKRKSLFPKMTKEERRQRFEAQVKAEDELAAQEEYQRQQEAYLLQQQQLMEDPSYFYNYQLQQSGEFVDPSMIPPETLIDPVTGQPIPPEVLIDPQTGQHFIDPSTGQHIIDPNTGQPLLQIDPSTGHPVVHHTIDPQTGQPIVHQQIDPNTGQPIGHHQIDPQTGQPIIHQIDPNTGQHIGHHQIDPQTGQPIFHHQSGQAIDPLTGQPVHHIDAHTGQPLIPQIDLSTGQAIQQLVSHSVQQIGPSIDPLTGQHIPQSLHHSINLHAGPAVAQDVDPHTGQLIQHNPLAYPAPSLALSHQTTFASQLPSQHLQATTSSTGLSELDMEEEVPPPPSPPTVPVTKLPPNWKTAKDSEGRVYYYHAFTRQTQWEMPNWDDNDDDSINDMDLDPLPPEEIIRQSKKKTTTAAADTSSEVARKIKDSFRIKMSDHIILYLNPYRKKDCKIGRISSTEDFKHLARKLTHHVMSKELKHCRHVEDLEVNENVKAKAKDYVRKYMSKFGANYRKSSSPQPD